MDLGFLPGLLLPSLRRGAVSGALCSVHKVSSLELFDNAVCEGVQRRGMLLMQLNRFINDGLDPVLLVHFLHTDISHLNNVNDPLK